MPYLGNDLQVAQPSYRNIDDISGSFNSSTTSFPLRVSGAAPVPFPINSNQCLISVAGVVQRPDDSGTEGFRISGGNIIFSSAPSTGADFFGVILAGADYVNVGANFPSGSAAVPSITFDSDLDTGIYNSAANQVSITTAGTERLRIDSAGQIESVSLGTAAAPTYSFTTDPNTGIYSPGADQVAISTNGSGRLFVDSSGNVTINGQGDLRLADSDSSNWVAFQAPATVASNVTWTLPSADGSASQVLSTDGAGTLSWASPSSTQISQGNTSAAVIDTGSDGRFVVTTEGSERARIDSSGRLLVGTSSNLSLEGFGSNLQIEATTFTASQSIVRHGGVPAIRFGRSGGSTIGSTTLVASGDDLGTIRFIGADGSDFDSIAAQITCAVDGTPGANDMPGRLVFSTTADGASSPTERFRISNNGSMSAVIPGGSTLYPASMCRAWVNFNGTGTVAIRASYNVSSITDNATGDFTINFTTAFADSNYSVAGAASYSSATWGLAFFLDAATWNVSGFGIRTAAGFTGASVLDPLYCCISVFR